MKWLIFEILLWTVYAFYMCPYHVLIKQVTYPRFRFLFFTRYILHVAKLSLKKLQSKRYDRFLTETQKIHDMETDRGVSSFRNLGRQVVIRHAPTARRCLLFCQNMSGRLPTLPTLQFHPWNTQGDWLCSIDM